MGNAFWIIWTACCLIGLAGLLLSLPAMYRREARRKEAGV